MQEIAKNSCRIRTFLAEKKIKYFHTIFIAINVIAIVEKKMQFMNSNLEIHQQTYISRSMDYLSIK